MTRYKIFKHPSGATEAVKEGWSWPAFFFSLLWAMVKGMWGLIGRVLGVLMGVVIGTLLLGFVVSAVAGAQEGLAMMNILGPVYQLIYAITFGASGNLWRERNLASRGFEQVNTVTAGSPKGALALCLNTATGGE